jgi:hypothetical protein
MLLFNFYFNILSLKYKNIYDFIFIMPRKSNQNKDNTTDKKENSKSRKIKLNSKVPLETTSVEQTPLEQIPVEQTPIEQTPLEQTPLETTPLEQIPVEQTPLETTPLEQTPLEQTPLEQTPLETTPIEQTPLEQTPLEQTPLEQTPLEQTPLEQTPDNITIVKSDFIIDSIYDDISNKDNIKINTYEIIENMSETFKKSIKNINDNLNIDSDNAVDYVLNENQIENILKENDSLQNYKFKKFNKIYKDENLLKSFNNFNESIILIQIIDGNIQYIEKEGYETRNQSVIDLLHKTNNFKKLPNCNFLVFTNDFQNPKILNEPYILSFCKKYNYNTNLFPNFNFNHWNEANIGNYEDVYDNFKLNQIEWTNKIDKIYWSGSNTNIIREKIYKTTINNEKFSINLINKNDKYIPLEECIKYKYLLNMNGHSYGGRLNYLFMSGSCVIILKNKDKEKDYEEFFYKYFIPGTDYIEILYNDNDNINIIIEKINESLLINNCSDIAENCYKKAIEIFKINNIYEYIYDLVLHLSLNSENKKIMNNTIMYSPKSKIYLNNRLNIDKNIINFNLKALELELILEDKKSNIINIKLFNNITTINFNNNEIFTKYTPLIINNKVQQKYEIIINNNELSIVLITTKTRFSLVKTEIPIDNFEIKNNKIKTENGGWWII